MGSEPTLTPIIVVGNTALVRVPEAPHYIASRPSRLIAKTDNIMGWFAKCDPAQSEQPKCAP